jgi:adenylylsulfate kinase
MAEPCGGGRLIADRSSNRLDEVNDPMAEEVHVTWHQHRVTREQRERLNGHRGCLVWFTGLSGCGKSTIANELDHRLHELAVHSFLLDGDNIRHGLNASPQRLQEHGLEFARRFGLGFSEEDRRENIRRVAAVAGLFVSAGIVTLAAFVSPYRRDRDAARRQVEQHGGPGDFVEVFVDAPLDVCEARDPKGLYEKARAGQFQGLTGVDAPYEVPVRPELTLKSAEHQPEVLADRVLQFLRSAGRIP